MKRKNKLNQTKACSLRKLAALHETGWEKREAGLGGFLVKGR